MLCCAVVLVAPALGLAQAGTERTEDDPEHRLWREIESLAADPPTSQPYAERVAALPARRAALLERIRSYHALYPGGAHRESAIQLELSALFEMGALRGASFDGLRERLAVYSRGDASAATRAEVAYWQILCDRSRAAQAATQPTSAPVLEIDAELLAAYRAYVAAHPESRHVTRMATVLFEDARRRGDLSAMQQIVGVLSAGFPRHGTTSELQAALRREENVGRTFWLTARVADGTTLDTRTFAGRPLIVVVWASFDARTMTAAAEIERRRAAAPEIAVVGINLDERPEARTAAEATLGISWPQVYDGLGWAGETVRAWGINRIPFVLVIDRDGRLLGAVEDDRWSELLGQAVGGK